MGLVVLVFVVLFGGGIGTPSAKKNVGIAAPKTICEPLSIQKRY